MNFQNRLEKLPLKIFFHTLPLPEQKNHQKWLLRLESENFHPPLTRDRSINFFFELAIKTALVEPQCWVASRGREKVLF